MQDIKVKRCNNCNKYYSDTYTTCSSCGSVLEALRYKKNKYKNKIIISDNIRYHSKLEYEVYQILSFLKKQNKISSFIYQHKIVYSIKEQKMFTYIVDFVVKKNNKIIYIETKGYKTALYKLKKKLIESLYGIKIIEVRSVKKIFEYL